MALDFGVGKLQVGGGVIAHLITTVIGPVAVQVQGKFGVSGAFVLVGTWDLGARRQEAATET